MKLQRFLSLLRQAVDAYHMIDENDRIAVALSGGKDSLAMLYGLCELKKFYPISFELVAISVDLGFDNMDFASIGSICEKLQIEYHIVKTQIADIVFSHREESNPCSLCSKMRKGALNDLAVSLGCNKVAYGHHKDDLIESMMMSLVFEGRIHTFAPVTYLDKTGLTLIRPLLMLYEGEIKGFCAENNIKPLKNACPVDGETKREYVKYMINQMNHDHPGTKNRMYTAIKDAEIWK